MIPRSWIIGAALAALVASNGYSLMRGKAWGERIVNERHAEAVKKLEDDLRDVTNKALDAEVARLNAERERNDLLADLDAEGNAADGADRVVLPAGSVQRINRIGRDTP